MRIAAGLKRWGVLAVGVILLIIGFAIASQPLTFGWFDQPPAGNGVFARFSPALLIMPTCAALVLAAAIALLAGWLGFFLGQRSHRNE